MGRTNIPNKRALKNRLVTRSHFISPEEETRNSPEVEKAAIWYKVILEIAQEVETSFPEVGKSIYLVDGKLRFPRKWKKLFTCKQIITEIFPQVEVMLKMSTKGLNFSKMQKSLRAKSMNK